MGLGLVATGAFATVVSSTVGYYYGGTEAYGSATVPVGAEVDWELDTWGLGTDAGVEIGGAGLNIIGSAGNGESASDALFTATSGEITYYIYTEGLQEPEAGSIASVVIAW